MTEGYNAANRKDIREAEKAAKFAESQRRETISQIMSVKPGRSWLLELLEACHVFSTSFSFEAIPMAFAEGERNIGIRLLNDIMAACPDSYILMMRERNERDTAASARRNRSDPNGGDQGSEQAPGWSSLEGDSEGDPA